MWSCKQPKEMHILLSPKGVTSIHYRKAKTGNRSALGNFNQQQQLKMKLEYSLILSPEILLLGFKANMIASCGT